MSLTLRIDSHMRLFSPATPEYPRGIHPLHPAERAAYVDDYLPVMTANGIDHAVIVALDHHDGYISKVVRDDPERFSAVGVVASDSQDPNLDFVTRYEQLPFLGFRVWELGDTSLPARKMRYFPLLESIRDRGMFVWFYGNADQLAHLPRVLDEIPDLKVVLNHLGFSQTGFLTDEYDRPRIPTEIPPGTLPRALALASYPNVNVHFSGQYAFSHEQYPYLDMRGLCSDLLDSFGAERLLWASDWPWIRDVPGYDKCIDLVHSLLPTLTDEQRSLILGGNAARLFDIQGG